MTVLTAVLIVIIVFFYFFMKWAFRFVLLVLIAKQIGAAIDKFKNSLGGKPDDNGNGA